MVGHKPTARETTIHHIIIVATSSSYRQINIIISALAGKRISKYARHLQQLQGVVQTKYSPHRKPHPRLFKH